MIQNPPRDAVPRTLPEKIDWLFENLRRPDGKEYTYRDVESGTDKVGYRVSAAYLCNLRKGKCDNPGWLVLRSLAQFFGVSVTYSYDGNLTSESLNNFKYEAMMQDADVEEITLRASKMGKAQRRSLLEMMRTFMKK